MKDFNMRQYIDIINEEQNQLNEFIWCGDRNMGVGSNITFGNYGKPHPDCRPSMGAMHDTQKMMHQNWEMELDDDEYEKLEQENELEDYRQDSRLIDRYARALNDQEFNMQEHIDTDDIIAERKINSQMVSQEDLNDPSLSPGALERMTALRAKQLNMIGKDGASRSRALRQIVQGANHGHGHGHHHHHNKTHTNKSSIAAGLLNKFESYDNNSMRQYINIANDIITEVEITQAELDDPNLSPEARERLINLIQTQLGHDCFSDYCDKDNADTLGQGWDMFKDGKPHTHRE